MIIFPLAAIKHLNSDHQSKYYLISIPQTRNLPDVDKNTTATTQLYNIEWKDLLKQITITPQRVASGSWVAAGSARLSAESTSDRFPFKRRVDD